ncbi:MAG: APC family permease [Gemmatimonadaceae bacterium]|nr:APC family permease [Gemmatimonadaceae bacterium]
MTSPPALRRGLTLATAAALAVGNQLGTSLYNLPASLAQLVGPAALLSWGLTALGFWALAELFARLGERIPATGGPAAFVREAMGPGWGFVTAWSFWGSVAIGNAGIALGTVAYIGQFVPGLDASAPLRALTAIALLWACVWLNIRGVREAGRVTLWLVALQLVPVLLLVVALGWFEPRHLQPFAPHGYGAVGTGVALIIWGFSGVESATISAEEVRGDPSAVARATRIGFWVAAGAYLLAAIALAGVVPSAALGGTSRPLALIAEQTVGAWGATAMSSVAIAGGLACLNGWVLVVGRLPLASASHMPRRLTAVHARHGTPHVALVTGTLVSTVFVGLQVQTDAVAAFGRLVLIANVGILVPYFLTAVAAWRLAPAGAATWRVLAVAAGAFSAAAIAAAGAEALVVGGLFLAVGVGLYVLARRRQD